MTNRKDIESQVFSIRTEDDFNEAALRVFNYQYEHNSVYREFADALRLDRALIRHYREIPFLPIEFFKTKKVICGDGLYQECFTSSATTGQEVSKHYVKDLALYETSFLETFRLFYGDPGDYCFLALLPNYLERTGSSLVYMADKLIRLSANPHSGFFLNDYDSLQKVLHIQKQSGQKTILLGVTYALLDMVEKEIPLNNKFIVMETGGMKGRRKEMVREELYAILKPGLHVNEIHSEYGMTELLSQAYSFDKGLFKCPPWMKVLVRDPNDPFAYNKESKSGGINVIDLANVYSCSFIATKDLGKSYADGTFEVLGRFDNSDIRGCNLMAG